MKKSWKSKLRGHSPIIFRRCSSTSRGIPSCALCSPTAFRGNRRYSLNKRLILLTLMIGRTVYATAKLRKTPRSRNSPPLSKKMIWANLLFLVLRLIGRGVCGSNSTFVGSGGHSQDCLKGVDKDCRRLIAELLCHISYLGVFLRTVG